MDVAAGLLLYRLEAEEPRVLLVHSSGSYNRHKPWGIPKGLLDPGETEEEAARRETWEETGIRVVGPVTPLGIVRYRKSGKVIHAFAAPGPADQEPARASWEIDAAEYLPLAVARKRIHPDQAPFLDRLLDHLRRG